MPSSHVTLTAGAYVRMAEELETMATAIVEDPQSDRHLAERLSLLAKQMREDSARLEPPPAQSG